MRVFLRAVVDHRGGARQHLLNQGHPEMVVYRKAEHAAKKGYTDYGVAADMCWLTDKGEEVLAQWETTSTGTSPTE